MMTTTQRQNQPQPNCFRYGVMMLSIFTVSTVTFGCGNDTKPAWAIDPINIQVKGDILSGFQNWQIYSQRWERSQNEDYYLCSVLVGWKGIESNNTEGCIECSTAWEVTPSLIDTDCNETIIEQSYFLSTSAIAFGAVDPEICESDPFPGQSVGSYLDYGAGFEAHGFAIPEEIAHDSMTTISTGEPMNFEVIPAFAFEL